MELRHTLCMPSATPILWMPIFAMLAEDRRRLPEALAAIGRDDSGVLVRRDPQTEELVYSGTSLDHLQQTFRRIFDEMQIASWTGKPRVRYLETIRQAADGEGKYIRQTGGAGNYGHVKLCVEPLGAPHAAGSPLEFVNAIRGDVVPEPYIAPIEAGIREAARGGVLAGHEVTGLRVTLDDGSWHEVDSNPMAFQIAASLAFREAARRASPIVLEPVMSVVFTVAEQHIGTILAAVSERRGRVRKVDCAEKRPASIHAIVPLAELLSFPESLAAGALLPRDPGASSYRMLFSHYAQAPLRDRGDEETGVPAPRPGGPAPRSSGATADLDW
jgi:elongation factor G